MGGGERAVNGTAVPGAAKPGPTNNVTPEERLVWAMLYMAAHDLLMFRRKGLIDENGDARIDNQLREWSASTGFRNTKTGPSEVVHFWRETAQEWIDCTGVRLDAEMCLKTMLRNPDRGMFSLKGFDSWTV